MPTTEIVNPRRHFATHVMEDRLGQDRLARSLLRTLGQLPPGSVVGLHGGPGSGKEQLLLRMAWILQKERDQLEWNTGYPVNSNYAWFNPWAAARSGDVMAGMVAALTRAGPGINTHAEAAREAARAFEALHTGAGGGRNDPIENARGALARLVASVKRNQPGRVLAMVDGSDHLAPSTRLKRLEGLRLAMTRRVDLTVIVGIGRESALEAIRSRDTSLSDESAARSLDDLLDMVVTTPAINTQRVGALLRSALEPFEARVIEAFGDNAIHGLTAAATNPSLAIPRFLERLALRVGHLAEYTIETRTGRELSNTQWAWIIISERWGTFRRFMIRGGRDRWIGLQDVVAQLSGGAPRPTLSVRPLVMDQLQADPLLASYLRRHGEGFERDAQGIFWLETLLLAAGL